ncbi:hypothetical protein [Halalkalibacter okhensis]|uniref:Uncharacterized protein n=1 Tax=Halalkalibacter okhensis TaxID=333138 RepID=A0A0B0IGF2_9BACI|nr:hypothetical protein [Halalkalibacter okhensis]KHF39932.1 hypothetical protein LQ50_12810 [Halalkalibacter okhensis]
MFKRLFSLLSIIFFILSVVPLMAGLAQWGNRILAYILNISIYLPFVLGLVGLIFGLFGLKGKIRKSLIILNIIALSASLFLIFVAMYGFQQP